jgi:hypothetical protein
MLTTFASTPRQIVVRWPAVLALLALLLIPFARPLPPVGSFAPTTTATNPSAILPAPLRASLFAQLGQDDPAAQLQMAADGTIYAPSIAGMETTLNATTLRLGGTQPTWQWMLQGWGRDANLTVPAASAPAALHANAVHFAQGGLDSWYVAGAGRIEQGWTIAERPTGSGPLLLSFAESGSLHNTLTADGLGLNLRDASGFSSLHYNGLMAFDATGRTIAAHFTQRGNNVAIVVDDATASYPLTIDPWVESATLTAAAGAGGDSLGLAVAISADGNTLVAGAPGNAAGGVNRGVVYVIPNRRATGRPAVRLPPH